MTFLTCSPLVVAGLAATVFLCIILYLTWQFRSVRIGRVAGIILVCVIGYSSLFTLALASVDPTTNAVLIMLQLPFRLILPVLSFLFILLYIGEIDRISPRMIAITCLFPAIILVTALTLPLHDLFVSGITPTIIDGRLIFTFTPGPFFWLSHGYSLILIIAGGSLALSRFVRSPSVYRIQIAAILCAFVFPYFMNAGIILFPTSEISVMLVIAGFALTAIALYVATLHYQFLTLTPVAMPVLFDRMADGVIIVNGENRIVDVNPAASRIIGKDRNTIIGTPLKSSVPGLAQVKRPPEEDLTVPVTLALPVAGQPRYFDLRYIPIRGANKHTGGQILVLHDTHSRHLVEVQLHKSNEILQMLISVTRHDIRNKLMILQGYNQLAERIVTDERVRDYLKTQGDAVHVIESQIEFTRDYQELGISAPAWQDVHGIIAQAIAQLDRKGITIVNDTRGLSVYADPMLEKVFYNLMENAIRHGMTVTTIKIHGERTPDGLVIIVHDDGIGIPADEKELIFTKGYGKNTGLGLFFTREILALTGCRIEECGTPGQSARFCIHVPEGAFRFASVPGDSTAAEPVLPGRIPPD
ncbi:MAG: histidine kinase N-terminal 7TM domain-containing protein [Methanoregula sp.]